MFAVLGMDGNDLGWLEVVRRYRFSKSFLELFKGKQGCSTALPYPI